MIDFTVRIGIFLVLLSVLLVWQWQRPRKPLRLSLPRWRHNAALMLTNALCVRLLQPLLLSLVALLNTHNGLLHSLNLPYWLTFILSLMFLDALIYWQHRLFHRIPWLWRIHKVHHSDPELDVSSAVRFHPVEIILSLMIKACAIWLLGVPLAAILVFDILLNGFAMFNHTNIRLPNWLEPWVRALIVTPDMHRIHHSRRPQEAHSNFGFCLSIWDRCFQSNTPRAQDGDGQLSIGLPSPSYSPPPSFISLIVMPFAASSVATGHTTSNNKTPIKWDK